MRNGVFKNFLYSLGGMVATLAVVITTLNVNTTCLYMAHQPKLPDAAKKLRKF
ncbi:MAG: cyclic lactone autoinducer peptide [Clostridia bacterium]|nr:cyclic lactone autoinducer peptide [Clostridia bacterium]